MSNKLGTLTPGPWEVLYDSDDGTLYITTSGTDTDLRLYLAQVIFVSGACEHELNAALMAAAPDLLQACQEALLYVTSPSITDEQDAADKAHLLATLFASIARATARQAGGPGR